MSRTYHVRQKLLQLFVLIILGSILTTILTWSFILKITSFYSDIGDYAVGGYFLWYNQFSLVTGRILNPDLFFNSFQFYPLPYSLAYGELLIIPSLIFAPLYWITQQLALSLNFYVFLSFVLTFISSFYCLNYFTKNKQSLKFSQCSNYKFASFLGSLVFTFNPLTFAHFPNHINFMAKYFLPPLLLYGYLFFKKPETKNSLLFFLFFTLNAFTCFQFMFLSNFAIAVYLIFFFLLNFYNKNYKYFINILKKSLFFLLFIPLLIFFYSPYLNFVHKEKATFDLQFLWLYSATLEDWVSPHPNNLLYNNIFKTNRTEMTAGWGYADFSEEHTLLVNIIPLILAILGLVFLFKSLRKKNKKEADDQLLLLTSIIILMVSVILSLGPNLAFNANHSSNIKLPFNYLMQWLPIFKGTRIPSRFQFIFYIPFSILVAYGSMVIFKARKRYFLLIFISLTILLIAENLNHFNFNSTSSILNKKDYIEQNFNFLNDKSTLHFPHGYLGEEARYLTFGTLTSEKMINGYSSYMPPDWFSFMKNYQKSLEKEDLKKLKIIGIQYVVIHKDLLSKEQVQNLSSNQAFIQKGIIFDKGSIQVINLDKFNFDYKLCNFDKDFSFKLEHRASIKTGFYHLSIENQRNCYLTNISQNRYRSKIVYQSGIAKTARIRMPMIIAPFEKISVDEEDRNLSVTKQ